MQGLLRYLPLLMLMVALDAVFFQTIIQPLFISEAPTLLIAIYWAIPISWIAILLFFPKKAVFAVDQPIRRDIIAIYQAFYISKVFAFLIGLAVLLIVGALVGLVLLLDLDGFFSDWWFSMARIIALTTFTVIFSALLQGMFRNRHRYRIHEVEIPILNLPTDLEGLKIVQLSDIHAGSFTKADYISPAIQKINDLSPDLICFTGDLVNNVAQEFEPYLSTFKSLKSKLGVYAILGNHDYGDYVPWPNSQSKSSNLDQLVAMYERLGWELIRDSSKTIEIGSARLNLIGVENISGKRNFKVYGNLAKAIEGIDLSLPTILMSHDPSHWRKEVLSVKNINLCLSGHTHGMQFGLEWGKFKWSPIQFVYKEWAGLYQEEQQFLYVNRGFGYLAYPGRVGILPEITLITLKSISEALLREFIG